MDFKRYRWIEALWFSLCQIPGALIYFFATSMDEPKPIRHGASRLQDESLWWGLVDTLGGKAFVVVFAGLLFYSVYPFVCFMKEISFSGGRVAPSTVFQEANQIFWLTAFPILIVAANGVFALGLWSWLPALRYVIVWGYPTVLFMRKLTD